VCAMSIKALTDLVIEQLLISSSQSMRVFITSAAESYICTLGFSRPFGGQGS